MGNTAAKRRGSENTERDAKRQKVTEGCKPREVKPQFVDYRASHLVLEKDVIDSVQAATDREKIVSKISEAHHLACDEFRNGRGTMLHENKYYFMNQGQFKILLDKSEGSELPGWPAFYSNEGLLQRNARNDDTLELKPLTLVLAAMKTGEFCSGVGAGRVFGEYSKLSPEEKDKFVAAVYRPQSGPDIDLWIGKYADLMKKVPIEGEVLVKVGSAKRKMIIAVEVEPEATEVKLYKKPVGCTNPA